MKKITLIVTLVFSLIIIFTLTGCLGDNLQNLENDTTKVSSKEASKETSKETSKEASKETSKESTTTPGKLSAPWASHEELLYVSYVNGVETINSKYVINLEANTEKKYYKIEREVYIKDGTYLSGALINFLDLAPVSSHAENKSIKDGKSQVTTIKGVYKDVLAITSNENGKISEIKVNLPKQYYDNEYFAMGLRELPIKDGFETVVNIAGISVKQVATLNVKVVGKEKIKVAFGEFECYKLQLYNPKKTDTDPLDFWISADQHRNLLKYGQKGGYIELKSIKY